MNPSAHEEEIDLSELAVRPAAAAPVEAPSPAPPPKSDQPDPLDARISALTERTGPPLGKRLQHILTELSRLIKYLQLIERQVSEETPSRKTVVIFRAVHDRAHALANFVNVAAAETGEGDETLYEVLNGIGFALSHELHRVYEEEATGLLGPEDSAPPLGRAVRAHGLLQNCFQQLIVTLLQALDPALAAAAIFEDFKIKREQSIVLYGELLSLLTKVRKAQNGFGLLQSISLTNTLNQFREDTLHFLMYQDWAEFEGFIAEIIENHEDARGFLEALRKFTSYLETLIAQVSMRTVLKS
jgi:hypothetical protein